MGEARHNEGETYGPYAALGRFSEPVSSTSQHLVPASQGLVILLSGINVLS